MFSRYELVSADMRKLMAEHLDPHLYYHSLAHTFDDVLPAAERIARREQIHPEMLELILLAAVLHDIGFIHQRDGHEDISIRMAEEILPRYGYEAHELTAISGMIAATKLPQSPTTLPEKILADADLDVLGRSDFPVRNQALRDELTAFGATFTDREWFEGQLRFLRAHRYFTIADRQYEQQKQQNIRWLEAQLRQVSAH